MTTTTSHDSYLTHQGEARWYGDSLFEFLIPSDVTDGQISVFRATSPRGFSPPRHIHTREDEVFLVESGDVTFEIDGHQVAAGPGTSVYMPRGVPHTFRIDSPVAQMLGLITPGDFEHLFRDLSAPAGARALPEPGTVPLDIAAVMAQQTARGTQVVGPPLSVEEHS